MAFKFNGDSINSINYNGTEILNLWHNGSSIWAKKYDDARICHVSDINSSLVSTISYVPSITNHNLERKSSLDASPSNFVYSDYKATVHWGDVFRAKGGLNTARTSMTLPSGDNIRISTDREIYLSGEVSLTEANAPKIVINRNYSSESYYYLGFSNFSQFGETYYKTYWNGSSGWGKTSEFCRCWIQLFKVDYKYSGGVYTIKSLDLYPTSKMTDATNYDTEIGGWVLSPDDFISNNNFSTSGNTMDGIFWQRYFRIRCDTSSVSAVWLVRTCYRNGWGQYGFTETFGATNKNLTDSIIISGLNNSSLAAVNKCVEDAVDWMSAKPYAKS